MIYRTRFHQGFLYGFCQKILIGKRVFRSGFPALGLCPCTRYKNYLSKSWKNPYIFDGLGQNLILILQLNRFHILDSQIFCLNLSLLKI